MAKGFRIAARALRQLGGELITSDDVALNELIKNAFDARSPRVSVSITATADMAALSLLEEQLHNGSIENAQAIERIEKAVSSALTLDARAKLIKKLNEYLDDKDGFTRFLKKFYESQTIVIQDRGRGMSKDDLADRFLVIGTPGKLLEKTESGKSDRPILGEKGIGRLSMMRLGQLATIRSKTKDGKWHEIKFDWNRFDDPALFLDQVEVEVDEATTEPDLPHGTEIVISRLNANWTPEKVSAFINKYIRRLQDPFLVDKLPYPIDIRLNEKRQSIASLPDWLKGCAQFKASIRFDPSGLDGTEQVFRRELVWHGTTTPEIRSWELSELTRQLGVPASLFKSLGRFEANCLWFNRQRLAGNGVERTRTEIADELNNWCGGFSIYRDNFRVGKTGGMDDDWLEWDSTALKAKGFALNRYQTVGSVAISSTTNPRLVDAANRERLISCPEQELLKNLLGEVIVQDLRSHIYAIRDAEAKLAIAEESTEVSMKRSEDSLKKTLSTLAEISKTIPTEHKAKVAEIREALHDQVEYVKTIKNSLNMARETKVEILELANIGLVVEIVIHELSRLTERTGELLSDLKTKKSDADILGVVDNLRSQINATNKRIRTVDVMSPSGRHRRERYDAVAQTQAIVAGFANRFKRHKVVCLVSLDERTDELGELNVYMVRGLIAQVLENLLSNSVYWLQQGLREGDSQRTIRIEIDSKALCINVSDNGPGIDPRNARDVFMPYYSTRKKGKGLGLYISRELVDYHGGQLYLDASEDTDGRLRTFVIELPKEEK
ncbi:ATP-binding protein [Massilia sp. YIM B02763]|uniref:sensor histidine kinase n=1 Tax=Massilia sp. YIM B02763 TaxID=3050130 RepID=UPI0025B718F5|nr:ATP-binding protein [Massilia sp. YIM B02763]MDN4056011.1 ATP-binding protein [Massilia sp. YIM B02763]